MPIEPIMDELFDFAMTAMTGVPAALKPKLRDTLRPRYHGERGVIMAIEMIYRNKAVLPVALLNIGAKLAEGAGGLAGMTADHRAVRIGAAIRKLAGTDPAPAPDATDPPVLPE